MRVAREAPVGLAVSPDGRSLAGIAAGGYSFWDVRAGRRLGGAQTVHASGLDALPFSGDGRWLAVGGGGSIVRTLGCAPPETGNSNAASST